MQRQPRPWFAVSVKPRMEASVRAGLEGKGYECFLPSYAMGQMASKATKENRTPLFPGYVFCRIDSDRKSLIVTTPGVIRIIGCGRVPSAIDDHEILSLQKVVESRVSIQPLPNLQIGNLLVITDGPLSGVVGVLETVNRRQHLVLSVTLLGRSVLVEVEPEWVRTSSVWLT